MAGSAVLRSGPASGAGVGQNRPTGALCQWREKRRDQDPQGALLSAPQRARSGSPQGGRTAIE
ncbi:MAG TPA: hypothetical protein DCY27_04965, partial [Desulfobacterales bacterium]|nr:hypothetical protein [Desulfobacterales bacterium]